MDDRTMDVDIMQQMAERLAAMLDDGLLEVDRNMTVRLANAAAVKMLGENPTGSGLDLVLDHRDVASNLEKALISPSPLAFTATPKRHGHRRLHGRMARWTDDTVILLLMDMTQQHNLEKVRRDFVANVGHELRSPLTGLIGFIETLQSSARLDEGLRQRFLKIMDEEARRMSRLIDDLMSLSRVEAEEHIVPTGKVFIDEVVRSVVASMANRVQQSGREILFVDGRRDKEAGIAVMGETDELIEVFHNLVDNAVKYGHMGSAIRIEMRDDTAGQVCFAVINRGDGIGEAHLHRLTERFYRVDKDRSRQTGGTGLGLAIVKHIVNRHRGHLKIASEPFGETVFSVFLPVIDSR